MPLVFIFNIIASERHLLILWTILGLPYYTLMFNFKNAHYTWNLLYSRFNFLCYTFKDEQIYLYFLIYCYIWCILFFNYKTDITWLILVASSEIIYLLLLNWLGLFNDWGLIVIQYTFEFKYWAFTYVQAGTYKDEAVTLGDIAKHRWFYSQGRLVLNMVDRRWTHKEIVLWNSGERRVYFREGAISEKVPGGKLWE